MKIYRYTCVMLTLLFALVSSYSYGQKLDCKQKKTLKNLKRDIAYLASDELMGRATGTDGEKKSAEFIAKSFQSNGLTPKGEQGYFQKFSITTLRIADKKTIFNLNGKDLTLYGEFYPLSYSSNTGSVGSAVADAGYGIVNKIRDDYKGVDAKDKVVFINLGSPDGIHPHSKFLAWHGISIRVDEAIKHGAKGVVFYRSSETVERPSGELSLTMKPSPIPVVYLDHVRENASNLAFASITMQIMVDQDMGYNVIGYKDNGAKTTVVIGAHHDHLGQGQHGNSLAENPNEIHNGADDNASGTAALSALAKRLKKAKKWNKQNNYLFIAFSGEEMGLLGSKYFVNNPTIDLSSVNYMLNMDMIGMLNADKVLIINGVGTSPVFYKSITSMNETMEGIGSVALSTSGIGPSDHTSFYFKGIPSLHYFTGAHDHYHKPSDDVDNLNYVGEVFVIQHMLDLMSALNSQGKIEFTKTKDNTQGKNGKSRMKLEVTLGVVPNYGFDGEGMQIDAVRDGKPGANAGISAKDIVISLAGQSIGSMGDYMKVLGGLKKGDNVEVIVLRGGKPVTLKVQF